MTKKAPKIELTFGKNDIDIYNWIVWKDVSNATFIKRLLRDAMNAENGVSVVKPVVESVPVTIETETVQEETKPAFGFMNKMGVGKEF